MNAPNSSHDDSAGSSGDTNGPRNGPSYDRDIQNYAGISSPAQTRLQDLEDARDFAEMIVDTVREGLLVLDIDLNVKAANESFYKTFDVQPEHTIGVPVYEIGNGQWDVPELRELLEDILPENRVFNDFKVVHDFEDIGTRHMLLNARQLNAHQLILLAIEDTTERWQAQERQRKTDARMHRILRQLPVGVGLLRADGEWLLKNPVLSEIIPGDLPSRTRGQSAYWKCWNKDGALQDVSGWPGARALRGETVSPGMDCLHTSQEGDEMWVRVSAAPIPDADNGVGGAVIVTEDITDRKRVAADRSREQALLETVLDTLPVGLVISDAEGRIVRDNEAARDIWGIPLTADSWRDYGNFRAWWPESGERIEADEWAVSRALLRGETTVNELIRYQKFDSDETGYYLNNVAPILGEKGEVAGAVGIMQDVTDRMAAEAAVRENEERFRKAIEIETVGVLFWDSDIRIREVNQAFLDMTGYSRDKLTGMSWRDLTPAQHRATSERAVAELKERGVTTPYEKEYIRSDGSCFWGLFAARRLNEDEAVEFVLDVTERKLAEQNLKEINETLEERVEKRTRQVRHLASTLTRAEQEERRRISRILHDDLQQQLYALQLRLSLARGDVEAGNRSRAHEQLKEADERIGLCIDLTRGLSVDLSPPILETEGLTSTLEWLKKQMKDLHDLEVEVRAPHGFRTPEDDLRVLLFQIVRELLFNVAKHAGTDRAVVSLAQVDDAVRIEVADDGRGFGMDASEEAIGEHFGLYSVRERLGLFGGEMSIESAPGEGTRVTMRVPLKLDPHSTEDQSG